MAALTLDQQEKTISLYKSGLSMQQVADYFGVGLGAVLYILRKNKIPRRTSAESNRLIFEAEPLSFTVLQNLTREQERVRLAAVMLYWAEGYKIGTSVDFANSDPDVALIFVKFLREICNVDYQRIRCYVYGYEGQNIASLTHFWSSYLDIPEYQFTKPYIKKAAPGPRGPRMQHGLVHVRYCDTKLLRQILFWINEFRLECVGGGVVNRKGL